MLAEDKENARPGECPSPSLKGLEEGLGRIVVTSETTPSSSPLPSTGRPRHSSLCEPPASPLRQPAGRENSSEDTDGAPLADVTTTFDQRGMYQLNLPRKPGMLSFNALKASSDPKGKFRSSSFSPETSGRAFASAHAQKPPRAAPRLGRPNSLGRSLSTTCPPRSLQCTTASLPCGEDDSDMGITPLSPLSPRASSEPSLYRRKGSDSDLESISFSPPRSTATLFITNKSTTLVCSPQSAAAAAAAAAAASPAPFRLSTLESLSSSSSATRERPADGEPGRYRCSRRTSVDDRIRTDTPIAKIRRTSSLTQEACLQFPLLANPPRGPASRNSLNPRPFEAPTPVEVPVLPTTEGGPKRITAQTLVSLLNGEFWQFDEIIVIDCRFDYEFDGGHINGAVNINTKRRLEERLFDSLTASSTRKCVVFHCEFSSQRGPRAWQYTRKFDREANGVERYPELHYPHCFVLDGGYKRFFQSYPEHCYPPAYIEMNDPRYQDECLLQSARNQKEWEEGKRR